MKAVFIRRYGKLDVLEFEFEAVRNALERQALEDDERAHARRVRAAAQTERAAVKP